MLHALKFFLWKHETSSIMNTRVTRSIRNNRCLVWITHINEPHAPCSYLDNLMKIHKDLSFSNLQKLGQMVYESGDARKEYSVIFELKR